MRVWYRLEADTDSLYALWRHVFIRLGERFMPCEAVVGLEVHAQLNTRTKIFCGCPVRFNVAANSHTCPVCLGLPGSLPVLNREAVACAVKAALAVKCRLNHESRFVRKHYFYPDLPRGYQISQLDHPLAENGFLDIETRHSGMKRIGISRIHLEDDAARLVHASSTTTTDEAWYSYVDYNRAGVPLIEIVSGTDMRSADDAGSYLRTLHAILRYLDVCDGNMELGSFRCDANVSIRPDSASPLGVRVEIKNMNSFRHVEHAIGFEINRQMELVENGNAVAQETRQWDQDRGATVSIRNKEADHDYRFYSDPDLAPLILSSDWAEDISKQLPELPMARRLRFIGTYGLSAYGADILTRSRRVADYFEETVALGGDPVNVSNWIMGEIMPALEDERDISTCAVTPEHLAQLLDLIEQGEISGKIAKQVFEEMLSTRQFPAFIISKNKSLQLLDASEVAAEVENVLEQYPSEVGRYRSGKKKLLSFFVGQVMKATGGRAHPGLVNELLRRELDD